MYYRCAHVKELTAADENRCWRHNYLTNPPTLRLVSKLGSTSLSQLAFVGKDTPNNHTSHITKICYSVLSHATYIIHISPTSPSSIATRHVVQTEHKVRAFGFLKKYTSVYSIINVSWLWPGHSPAISLAIRRKCEWTWRPPWLLWGRKAIRSCWTMNDAATGRTQSQLHRYICLSELPHPGTPVTDGWI